MLVREVMSESVFSVRPNANLKEAVLALDDHQITAMPVIDETDRLIGVLSEADVIRDVLPPDRRAHETPVHLTGPSETLRVSDVMSTLPLYVGPDDDLARAVELLVDTQVKSLPVVDHDRVVGMVSRRDVIRVLARGDELIECEIDDLLRSAGVECFVEVVDGVVRLNGPTESRAREIARVLAASVPGVVAVGFDEKSAPTT